MKTLTERHPLPWKIAATYEHRADIHDANGTPVTLVKVDFPRKDVGEIAAMIVDTVNAASVGAVGIAEKFADQGAMDAVVKTEVVVESQDDPAPEPVIESREESPADSIETPSEAPQPVAEEARPHHGHKAKHGKHKH